MSCCAKSRGIKRPNEWRILQHKDCLMSMWCPHESVPPIQIWVTIQEKDNRWWIARCKDNWLFGKQLCMPSLWGSSVRSQDNAEGKMITRKVRLSVCSAPSVTTWELPLCPPGTMAALTKCSWCCGARCPAGWYSWQTRLWGGQGLHPGPSKYYLWVWL